MNFWIYYGILIILLLTSLIVGLQIYAWDNQEHGLFIIIKQSKTVSTQEISPNIKIFDIDGMGYLDRRHTVRDVTITITLDDESVSGKTNRYGFYSGALKVWNNGFYNITITAEKGDMYSEVWYDFRAEKFAQGGSGSVTSSGRSQGGNQGNEGDQGENEGGDEQ